MNTRVVQIVSSIFLGIIALFCTFLPDEVLTIFHITESQYLILIIQILGALYFGFAITNWMAKAILIGGIYGKALYLGNFVHFLVGTLVLLRWNMKNEFPSTILIIMLIGYIIFAGLYALYLFVNPRFLDKK